MRLFMLAAVLLASTSAISATTKSGNQWVSECKNKALVSSCYTYARGLADGLFLWEVRSPDTAGACIPDEVQAGQLVDVSLNYIARNPKTRHEAAGFLLFLSFIEAWPCTE